MHSWDVSPQQAVQIQKELAARVRVEPLAREVKTIAGADISFNKFSDIIYAGIVVLDLETLQVIEKAGVTTTAKFPYVPGLLSFREMPALIEAWEKLQSKPDVLVMDGQGRAHPRRMGVACHAGLWFDVPALGCAKSVLVGKFDEPLPDRGSWSPMLHRDETVGVALRTKNKVQPVYVSPGHLIDLPGARDLMLRCDGGYRVPEPTRQAHLWVNELRLAG